MDSIISLIKWLVVVAIIIVFVLPIVASLAILGLGQLYEAALT